MDPVLRRTLSTLAVAFMCEFLSFSRIDPASATLGSHLASLVPCETPTVIKKAKKTGALFCHSSHNDCIL